MNWGDIVRKTAVAIGMTFPSGGKRLSYTKVIFVAVVEGATYGRF